MPDPINLPIGYGNTSLDEPNNRVTFNYTTSETVFNGQHNTWIVLGRDRPSGSFSGYGGAGSFKAGAIDIVAGRLSSLDASTFSKEKVVNSNFGADASRVYISQRSDIDDYFNLTDGATGKSKNRAAIAIKSDDVRIIARNTLKLITRTDDVDSNREWTDRLVGVQLIGNNSGSYEDMQPIPKGKNLYNCIYDISSRLHELAGQLLEFMIIQKKFNQAITSHKHFIRIGTSLADLPTSEGFTPNLQPLPLEGKTTDLQLYSNVEQQINFIVNNIEGLVNTYLIESSPDYINSKYHKLN